MNIISSQAVVLLLSIAAAVLMVMLVVVCFRQKKLRDSVNAMDRDEVAGCLTEHGFFAHGLASIAGREDMIACIYMTIPQAGYIERHYEAEKYREFLHSVPTSIKNALGDDQYIMRTGDDSFVFLMQNRSHNEIRAKLDNLCDLLNQQKVFGVNDSPNVRIKPVFGISLPETRGESLERIVQMARIAVLDTHKNLRYSFYSRESAEKNARDYVTACSIPQAIRNGELIVYYQPKVRLSDQKIIGAEALVRWRHTKHGILSPDMFLAIAERFGMLEQIDRHVFTEVCRTLAAWTSEGREVCPISVNLSSASADRPEIAEEYAELCRTYGVSPSHIEFEFKEHLLLENPDTIRPLFEQLHSHGFRCSVDNFGAALCSLQLLGNFSIDTIKLDRSFFTGMNNNRSGRYLIEAILRLAAQMHISTVAEGVDHAAQVQYLRQAACDSIQGFYFFKPMPQDRFENEVYDDAMLGYAESKNESEKADGFSRDAGTSSRNIILFNYNIEENTVEFSDVFSPVLGGRRIFENALALFRTTNLIHEKDREDFLHLLDRCRYEDGWLENTLRFRMQKDRFEWLEVRIHRTEQLITGMLADMSGWKNEVNRWKEKATRDPLTGLYNRAQFEQSVSAMLEQKKHECGALVFVDVDDFKRANDTYGHMFGDDVLCFVAKQLLGIFRHTDIIARYAGDEFVVFAPSMDPEILKARLQKLLATFQYPYRNDNIEYPVSVTLGAAIYPHDGTDYATLLEHADCALYEAKENGKKQFMLYEPYMKGESKTDEDELTFVL